MEYKNTELKTSFFKYLSSFKFAYLFSIDVCIPIQPFISYFTLAFVIPSFKVNSFSPFILGNSISVNTFTLRFFSAEFALRTALCD